MLCLIALICVAVARVQAQGSGQAKIAAPSEASYKAACQDVAVAELTKNADQLKGRKVKYTGKILAMDFPIKDDAGKKKTPFRIILSVEDPSKVLESGLLPVFVTFTGETDAFVYDTITVYGVVYGNDNYESMNIKKKLLPRVDAKYLEKSPAEKASSAK